MPKGIKCIPPLTDEEKRLRHNKSNRKYREKNKKKCLKYEREYQKQNIKKIKKQKQNLEQKIKKEIFELLGNKCNNPDCPIPHDKMDIRALQIDHINGGGNKERKEMKLYGYRFYKYILYSIKNGSKDYQLLCAYCNWIKRYENNEV
jgi:hypothetical protein